MTRSFRILHVFDHSIPIQDGYSYRSRAIIRAQRDMGWDTVHVTSSKHYGAQAAEEEFDGLRFHRTEPGIFSGFPLLGQFDVIRSLAPRIEALARKERVDLIHAHSPCLNGLAAVQAGKRLGIPVVYEVRAFWEDAAVDNGTAVEGGARYRLTRALESRVLRSANQVTCICEGLRGDIVARGIDAGKVAVISNAVDIEAFPMLSGRDHELEAKYGLQGTKVLGFIGSFYAYEGLDLLLAAMPGILETTPKARLLLVGGGPEDERLRAQVENLRLSEAVIFAGRVPHGEVPGLSSLVDLFVFPRKAMRLTELVTPLKPLEAMAQGKLVAASDVGGHRELIEDGKTGFLFRHDDVPDLCRCVAEVFASGTGHAQVIQAGRRFVETERNWTASVKRYAAVYEDALAVRRGYSSNDNV